MPQQNMLDEVANDLALWIDQISTDVAVAFAANHAPFSASVSEKEKLEFYKAKLFNPDGSPNAQGRAEEMERLGSDGFATVLKAVVKEYPELKPPEQPQADLTVPEQWPQMPPGGPPGAPGAPPGLPGGLPPGLPGRAPMLPGPPGAAPPRPPMMPPVR